MADPVNTATGELFEHVVDVTLPSYGGAVAIARTYSSADEGGGLLGPGWRFGYESSLTGDLDGSGGGLVTQVTPEGAERVYERQPDGGYLAPAATWDTLEAVGGTFEVSRPDGSVLRYDAAGRLVAVASDDGHETVVAYDAGGQVASVTAPGGRQLALTVASTAQGVRLTRVDASEGRSVAYAYDGAGRLASVTDLRGEVWSYRYDGAGRLDRVTDPLGHHVHTTTYDPEGRVVEQVDARGGVTTFVWGLAEGSGWVTMTDPAGGQHTDFYAGHVLLARYDPAGRRTAYHYDERLRLTRLDQPDGTTVTFDHDGAGRLTHTHTHPPWEPAAGDDPGLAATVQTAAGLDGLVFGVALEGDGEHAWVGRSGSLARVELASATVTEVAAAADHAWTAGDTLHSLARVGATLYVAAGWHGASGSSVRSRVIAYDLAAGTSQVVADLGADTRSQIGAVAATPDGTVLFTRQWGEAAVYRLTPGVGEGFEPVHVLPEGEPAGIAADAEWLYVQSTAAGGSLVRMDHDGGDVSTLATGLRWNAVVEPDAGWSWQQTRALGLAGGHLYTSAGGGSALARVRLDDGAVQHVAGSVFVGEVDGGYADARFQRIHDLAVTDGRVVLTDRDNQRLAVVADDGVTVEVPDGDQPEPPAALTAETVYDGDGRVAATIDAAGRETTYDYDTAGRVTSVTGPDGVATSIVYDPRGLPVEWDTGGLVTAAAYDAATGDLLSVSAPDGATTTWTYDTAGRVVATVPPAGNVAGADPAAHTTVFTYDDAGLLLSVADPLGRTVAHGYDASGRLAATTDPAGRTTTFDYDPAGNLTDIQGPDAAAGPVTTVYDLLGRPLSVTDAAGRVTARSYDAAGNVVEVSDATGSATLAHDLAGRVVASTDQAGRTTVFDYDPCGQPAAVRYGYGVEVAWRYDDAGRLVEQADATGTVTYSYDAHDRPVAVTGPQGLFAYDWDALGRLLSRTTPDGGVDSWVYDLVGRLAEVRLDGQLVAGYGYDDAGRLSSVALGNGAVETLAYDAAGRLAALEAHDPSGALAHRAAYSYDLLDRPVRLVDALGEQALAYDTADRLARVCFDVPACDGSESDWVAYDVDAAGDRLAEQRPGVARTYGYDQAGRLAEVTVDDGSGPVTERTFAYDTVGNTIAAGGQAFGWDAAGRLTSATVDGTTTAYAYDARGLRASADDGQTTTGWLRDPLSGELVDASVDDGAQPSLTRMLPGGHGILVGSTAWWQHRDAAGSVRTVTDTSGTAAYRFDYEPFGALREVRDGSGTPLPDPGAWPVGLAGFHGHAHEPSGLVYARARWLDPTTGRFLSPDPACGGYGYAFANPVVFADPGGLWPQSPFSAYLQTMAQVAGYVAVGTVAAALVVGAPLTAPLVAASLLATGAVMLAADIVHATGTCTTGKGGCGHAVAMAGIAAAGGRYLRPLRALKTLRNTRPATLAANTTRPTTRAEEVHGALDPIAQSRRTTAVVSTREGRDVLAGGVRDLTPAQRGLAGPNDVLARFPGEHAEITALKAARDAGLTPQGIATTTKICPACRAALQEAGATITGPRTAWWP